MGAAALLSGLLLRAGGGNIELSPGVWRQTALDWLQHIPLWLYLPSFVILPAFGVPMSLFYLTVGAFADGLPGSLALAWCGMVANMAVSYLVAKAASGPVHRFVRRRGYGVPQLHRDDAWKAIVALRVSPLPYLLQSWLLTLGGARFLPYMLFGAPVQAMVGLGFVVLGESLLAGELGWAMVGVVLLLAGWLGLSVIRRRTGRG
jgi:hypothetical protein